MKENAEKNQSKQVLGTLKFDFLALTKKKSPKIFGTCDFEGVSCISKKKLDV